MAAAKPGAAATAQRQEGSAEEGEEQRLRAELRHLQAEAGVLERLVYKHRNQHRGAAYFQYLIKLRRDLKIVLVLFWRGCKFFHWEMEYVQYLVQQNYLTGHDAIEATGWVQDRRQDLELRQEELEASLPGQDEMVVSLLREIVLLLQVACFLLKISVGFLLVSLCLMKEIPCITMNCQWHTRSPCDDAEEDECHVCVDVADITMYR